MSEPGPTASDELRRRRFWGAVVLLAALAGVLLWLLDGSGSAQRMPAVTESVEAEGTIDPDRATAWVVRAGAYERRASAVAVRDALRESGFPSFVRQPRPDDALYRVLVGPIIGRERAAAVGVDVGEQLGRRVRLSRYDGAR